MTRTLAVAFVAAVLAVSAAPGGARADDDCSPDLTLVDDKGAAAAFVASVRQALSEPKGDRLSALIRFPLRVNTRDPKSGRVRTRTFRTVEDFRRHSRAIFDERLREQVLGRTEIDVTCASGAFGLTNGLIWASPGADGRILIYEVNNDGLP